MDWTVHVASRIEAVDSAASRLIGHTPSARVHVVVADPYNQPNGSALPFLKHPFMTFWAVPPSPRDDIGEYPTWGEILSSHEFAHIAHLSWPSRNPFWRAMGELSPVDLGPIPIQAPRWVIEGYATYVEGRVTGSGRPYGHWRAALLRQWGIEGRLPTYDQMSESGSFNGGEFAYLVGSAYLEWLSTRASAGDSSLPHVWRRLTARRARSFDEAFAGVYGESPAYLYARFAAEVTAKAFMLESTLGHDSPDGGPTARQTAEGDLVQHLAWETGDPSISEDGERVALLLRSRGSPSRVVVWKTAPEPDTSATRRERALLTSDSLDVPARAFYPPPKHALATLVSRRGYAYQDPRFFHDGHRVLVWRDTPQGDGSIRPDLYIWDLDRRSVHRVTHDAALRDADPSRDDGRAVAARCLFGRCDLAAVDLRSGSVSIMLTGSPDLSFYRPRYSPDGTRIAFSVHHDNRWRVAVADTGRVGWSYADPDDGANRYDAAWLSPTSLVVVSDLGGIANLERLDLRSGSPQSLTRVTGAAVAPAPNLRDGSVWFLSLHSRGYDVRRLAALPSASRASHSASLDTGLVPVVPPVSPAVTVFGASPISRVGGYGTGPHFLRWIPAAIVGADGAGAVVAVEDVDPVGRLALLFTGADGEAALWRGAALSATWRGLRPALRLVAFAAHQEPPQLLAPGAPATILNSTLAGGLADVDYVQEYDGWRHDYRLGGSLGSLEQPTMPGGRRVFAFMDFHGSYWETGDGWQLVEGFGAHASTGVSPGVVQRTAWQRALVSVGLATSGSRAVPLGLSVQYGRFWDGAGEGRANPFELFAVGGTPSPVVDPVAIPQRISMPALPTGAVMGDQIVAARVSTSVLGTTPFYWLGRAASSGTWEAAWHRVYGLEWAWLFPPMPVLTLPGARVTFGVGRSSDAPFAGETRAWLTFVFGS